MDTLKDILAFIGIMTLVLLIAGIAIGLILNGWDKEKQ